MRHAIVVCFAPVVRFFFFLSNTRVSAQSPLYTLLYTNVRRAAALRAARLEGFAPSSAVIVHAHRGSIIL